MNIGNKIKTLRLQKTVTQEQLAEHMKVSAQAVSKWENNVTLPDIMLLPELAVYFGVSIDELFSLTDEKEMERIENMLEMECEIPEDVFKHSEHFLKTKLEQKEKIAESVRLLANLYQVKAEQYQKAAEYYALEAIKEDPENSDCHKILGDVQRMPYVDWCAANQRKRVDYYKKFVKEHPSYVGGYLWLMDALLLDHRVEEAQEVLQEMKKYDTSIRVQLYEGNILWEQGKQEEAMKVWDRMVEENPKDWLAEFSLGDGLAKSGKYKEAIPHYEKAYEKQASPKYTDAFDSIGQIYEILGDKKNAVKAYQKAIEVLRKEWNITEGKSVDDFNKLIDELEK